MKFVDRLPGGNGGRSRPETDLKTMNSPKAQRAEVYECSECGEQVPQALIFSKKVSFSTIGGKRRVFKVMTAAWLCLECLNKDEHFKPATGLR